MNLVNLPPQHEAARSFRSTEHFHHLICDNFLDVAFAKQLKDKFPKPQDQSWWAYSNPLEVKFAFNDVKLLDPVFHKYFEVINSNELTSWLCGMSGLDNLHSDPDLLGGGLHMIGRGGKLDVHEDFNIHKQLMMLRSINIICYLNEDWDSQWGGELELWDKDMQFAFKKISPVFNRAVIFRTDMNSNHGHPHPLQCPPDRFRMSLASYYYREVDDINHVEYRSTCYKKLPGPDDGLDELRHKRKFGRIEDKTSR